MLGDDNDDVNGNLLLVWISYLTTPYSLKQHENEEVEDEEVDEHLSVTLLAIIPDIDKMDGKCIESLEKDGFNNGLIYVYFLPAS